MPDLYWQPRIIHHPPGKELGVNFNLFVSNGTRERNIVLYFNCAIRKG